MAVARRCTPAKHRKPRTQRRVAARRTPLLALGTAVGAFAAVVWLPPAGSALGDVRSPQLANDAPAAATASAAGSFRVAPRPDAAGSPQGLLRRVLTGHRRIPDRPWVKPVVTYTKTAHFGEISGLWAHRHTGQDFAAPVGTPVRATGDAIVVSAQPDGAYGNEIVLQHADGSQTWYCHLSAFLVHPGDVVAAGQVIGKVGATGNTTGPHLHFEVRPGGKTPVDPVPWLRAHHVTV